MEYEGSLYRVPKELKEAVIRHADYTRKTQEVAQLRNMAAAERQALQQSQALDADVAEERMQVAGLDAQIKAYKKLDWSSLSTDEIVRYKMQLDQLSEAKAEVEKDDPAEAAGVDWQAAGSP